MKYLKILTIIFLFLLSCSKSKKIEQVNVNDLIFDSLMNELTLKYSVIPKPYPDSLKFSDVYEIKKRIFLPYSHYVFDSTDLRNLNIELRNYGGCGGCWNFEMLYFFNQNVHFILPLSDYYLYWQKSCYENIGEEELNKKINFNKELNEFFKKVNIKYQYIIEIIIEEIMISFLNCYELSNYDIPKLKLIAETIRNDKFYNDGCKSKLFENLEKIKNELKNDKKKLYTDGVFTYIFEVKSDGNEHFNVNIEILNHDCLIKFLW